MSNALLKGLDVLRCFTQERRTLSASEIARMTGMPQPTAWRVCKALESQGYLVTEQDGKYRPGLEVLNLGYAALNTMNIAALAAPDLQSLSDSLKGTAGLSTPEGASMLFLQRCEAAGAILNYNMKGGVMVPIGNSASGWAYLSLLSDDQRDAALKQLRASDPTHAQLADRHLAGAIRQFRSSGFVINDEVFYPGLLSIAVPFRSSRRGSYYVVSCTAMKTAFESLPAIEQAAQQLLELGARLADI
ncbi:IclR family transcriptional regulator [Ramlibacter sp. G-1-2-2]|uniref:IclR family transcriptional regulator n=1 Tax=Ramlibacter agri TaxID=2728837 RepID=A0A848H7C2_9BURK|nr:IclR family transcriptional regulator [Ramlibacter agri]NML46404.1 IclR family transcriptional regulator [Ramlibacter agri]